MTPYGRLKIEPTIRLSDVEWLLQSGEDLEAIAGRLEVTEGGILKALRTAGAKDLLAQATRGRD